VTSNDMLLTGCTQTRTEIRYPTRFESKQSRSAWEVGDAARWMLATDSAHRWAGATGCNGVQLGWNWIKTTWSFSLFSAPGICTVNEDGDKVKSREETISD
jgi:hypothetical protein